MRSDPAQNYWENAIRALARRVNFLGWLDRAAPGVFVVGTVAGFTAYALRRIGSGEATAESTGAVDGGGWLALGVAIGLLAAGGGAWWRARKTFFNAADARALLEHRLGLDSALSAAAAGVAVWPAPAPIPATLRWRAPNTLGWLAGALALGLAGAWLPVAE
ncbi:MAG: hypothetical protein H7067_01105, partial [Burkholderiales bacterium]|nr:hypothetical protein [Opitutaceae bacterium]